MRDVRAASDRSGKQCLQDRSARNQLRTTNGSGSITSQVYDAQGRREQEAVSGSSTLNFLHDGSSVLGWLDSHTGNIWNFLSLPGGGALAGSYTAQGTTTTWVPLIDASGSTIALVNAASTPPPAATTYTYDPSGTSTLSGTANNWPFLYQGVEKEFTDPGPLYYSGGGQFYSPKLVRSLSETSQTSTSGPGAGPSGNSVAGPSGSSVSGFDPTYAPNVQRNAESVGGGLVGGFLLGSLFGSEGGATFGPVGAVIGGILGGIAGFFEALFGGSSDNPPTPRQLLHGRHPLYPDILGVPDGLIPDEASDPVLSKCNDAEPPPSGTLALSEAMEAAGAVEVVGGGPEDPVADFISAGVIVVGGAVACYEAYQSYAKGGKQNLRDSGLEGKSDAEIEQLARDPSLPPQVRQRYIREAKARKLRNKTKRR